MALVYTPPGELGAPAPDFVLPGVDGVTYGLADFAAQPVLLVMFICNHCPYVQAVEERLIALAREVLPLGAAVLAINSNDTVSYPADSLPNMAARAKELGYPFPYLFDETQEVAHAFGAVCTPDFFLYDAQRTLRYRGRLDDSPRNPAAVRHRELREAIFALLNGEPLAAVQHPSMGCSLKWLGQGIG